jgi:mRNA interferase RelE/StbE
MPYKIVLTKSAAKELGGLSSRAHDNVVKHLLQLEEDPRGFGSEKLTGIEAYKLRVGNHRLIYEIDDRAKTVRIVMVDDRKQVYKRLKKRKS